MERIVARLLVEGYRAHATRPCAGVKRGGRFELFSYQEVERMTAALALSLLEMGVEPGDRVAIMSRSRLEWMVADHAVAVAGAVVVPIYPTLTEVMVRQLLADSGTSFAIAEGKSEVARIQAARPGIKIVSMEPVPGVLAWPADRSASLAHPRLTERLGRIGEESLVSFLFTSGTTGRPKGVLYDNRGAHAALEALLIAIGLREDDVALTFLPMSHALGRGSTAAYFHRAVPDYFAESLDTVAADFASVRPTCAFTVPRVFEKAWERIQARASASRLKRHIFQWGIGVAREAWAAGPSGEGLSVSSRLKRRVADRLLFSQVRGRLGGRVRVLWSGGASLPAHIAEFFALAGVPIRDVYGMSEFGLSHISPPGELRFGSCGKVAPGFQARLGPDGEILVKTEQGMVGYHEDPEATASFREADGWMHTGDIGRVDADGWWYVTDRKKSLIVLSNGKKVAPGPLEARLCESPAIAQAVVIGEGRSYLVALVVPNLERKLAPGPLAAEVQAAIDALNATLPSFETIKRFAVLPEPLSEERGELTPTQKIRRAEVSRRHAAAIDALYAEAQRRAG